MNKLTNAERIFRALRLEQPDRVPHFEISVHPRIMDIILPGATYEEFVEYLDWDAVVHRDRYRVVGTEFVMMVREHERRARLERSTHPPEYG